MQYVMLAFMYIVIQKTFAISMIHKDVCER